MEFSCAVNGCANCPDKAPGITFHRFPKDPVRRARWVEIMQRADWQPNDDSHICSAHFQDKCFDTTGPTKQLKDGVEPSINLSLKNNESLLKWGIAGVGKIANDFASALKNLPVDKHVIWSIAGRNKEKLDAFASKFKVENIYLTYEDLAKDPDVDVVYVANLNPQHFSTCKLMLENGKGVLCEKPMCMNVEDTEQLFKIAKQNNLFLMEAVWSRFFPVYKELKNALNSHVIGDVHQLTANFGVVIDAPRVRMKDMGGSVVMDIGVYTSQLALLVFAGVRACALTAIGHLNSCGVDESYSCIIKYEAGRTAVLNHHSQIKFDNSAFVYGTRGFIKIHEPFWAPTKITINDQTLEFRLPENDTATYNFLNSAGLHYEADEVYRCFVEGRKESSSFTQSDSLALAKINEDLRKLLGVKIHDQGDPESKPLIFMEIMQDSEKK